MTDTLNPLSTSNLDLSLDGRIAVMKVTGKMQRDTLTESYDWLSQASEITKGDALQLRVEIRDENFDNLSEAREGFQQVGDVFRHVPALNRCAVVTDSGFLRNTAKVEGAVIPGMDLLTFAPDGIDAADKWLRGEKLTETVPAKSEAAPVALKSETPKSEEPETEKAGSEWANLSMKKVKDAL